MAEKERCVSHDGHRQRMKDRFLRDGLDGLQEHEVLELLLYYALPYRDTNGLGHLLIDRFGGLCKVLDGEYADLRKVPGVTPHVATLLTLCGQTAHRYMRQCYDVGTQLYDTDMLGQYVLPWFVGQKNESVLLISLDNRCKLLNATRIFEGSVNSTQFNFRQVLQQVLQDNATQVVLAHNHPSGFAIPSAADVDTTRRFASVLAVVGVRLLDHLIVSENDYVSMADTQQYRDIFQISSEGVSKIALQEK